MKPLTIDSSDLLAIFKFTVPTILYTAGLVLLLPKRGMLPSGEMTIPLNWNVRLPLGHFGLLTSLRQQAKKGIMVVAGVNYLDYKGNIVLLFHNVGKK